MPVVVVQDVRSGRNELVPAAVECDPSGIDNDDPGHQVGEGGQLVGDDDEGQAFGDEPREHLDQPVLAGDVDAGRIAFDGSRDEFVAAGSDVLHDHDWHHHLDRPDRRPAVISAEGPLSQGGSRE